jgi:hypothetical protein
VERLAGRPAPSSWRVTGGPRELTFAIENVLVLSVSSAAATVSVVKSSADLYLLPLDSRSGQGPRLESNLGAYQFAVLHNVKGVARWRWFPVRAARGSLKPL